MDFREALQAGKIGIGGASDHWTRLFAQKVLGGYAEGYAEGAIASFNDAINAPVDKLLVAINPVQAGTGDPSPTNVRPISGWTGANVCRTGANIWDEQWEVGKYDPNNGNKVSSSNNIRCKYKIRVKPNTTYSFAVPRAGIIIVGYDENENYVNWLKYGTVYGNITFTTLKNNTPIYYIAFCTYDESHSSYTNDISINYPATDTDYHAYTGTTYPITFPTEAGTVYGGEVDVTSGVLTVDFGYIDLGDLVWSIEENTSLFYASVSGMAYGVVDTIFKGICTNYKSTTSKASNSSAKTMPDKTITNRTQTTRRLYIMDNDYSDAGAFQTAMNGVYLVYPLATPITYQLTPTEVTTLLGVNNVWADTGDVKVWYKKKK